MEEARGHGAGGGNRVSPAVAQGDVTLDAPGKFAGQSMKIIHITDVHLVPPGQQLFESDPQERLHACLAHVATHHADANMCIMTGDLAHDGDEEAYVVLRDALRNFPVPVRLVVGNHDDRRKFRNVFPDAEADEHGFIQSYADTPAGRFIFLDTKQDGTHAGWYCEKRQAWLDARLGEAAGKPAYLFMHHPPFRIHLQSMDTIMLRNPEAFAAVVERHNIGHVFFGHVHRPVSGMWRNIPFSTLAGLNHQTALDFAESGIVTSLEPPAYSIAFFNDTGLVIHNHEFLDRSPRFRYNPNRDKGHQVQRMQSDQ
ncbi:phosphodiesterase [Burkholderia sp. Bp9142]|uniref:phosphodiesterase n=1 Tax=Burkholderia sp. Bp9142 TaxID=2184573 RepID=UPI0021AB29FF|nr:phosphodiesterase [Burkholderia sp. Bp9142]